MDSKKIVALKAYLAKVYTDDDLLLGLLDSFQAEEPDPSGYISKHGLDFEQNDWKILASLSEPGPNFEVRIASGVYRFDANPAGFWELMVKPLDGRIFVDAKPVQSQAVDDSGLVTFTTESQHHIRIQFQCALLHKDDQYRSGFTGEISRATDKGQKTRVTGFRFYPWGNILDKTPRDQMLPNPRTDVSDQILTAVQEFREDAALESFAAGLGLLGIKQTPKQQLHQITVYDIGDVHVSFAHLVFVLVCAGIGTLVGGVMGSVFAGFTSASTRQFFIDLKDHLVQSYSRSLANKVKLTRIEDLASALQKMIQADIEPRSLEQLRSPNLHQIIREKVKDAFSLHIHSKLDERIYRKYGFFRKYWKRNFKSTYSTAIKERFDTQVPAAVFDDLIKAEIDHRLVKTRIPEQLATLGIHIEEEKQKMDSEISAIQHKEGSTEWQAEKQKIQKEHDRSMKDIETLIKEEQKDMEERKSRSTDAKLEGIMESIQSDTERNRKDGLHKANQKEKQGEIV